MKKKALNAKRSGKADSTTPQDQETPEKTAPKGQTRAREESSEDVKRPAAPACERRVEEPLERACGEAAAAVPEPDAAGRAQADDDSKTAEALKVDPVMTERGRARETSAADTGLCNANSEAKEDEFDEGIIEHVQLLASLIDKVELSRHETIELLMRLMRQHSIAKGTALDYVLRQLKKKPP